MGAEQSSGEGRKRTISGEMYDTTKANTKGPGAGGMSVEEVKRKVERDSDYRVAQAVAEETAMKEAKAAEVQKHPAATDQTSSGINQPLYMLIALGVVVFGIVLLSLNGLENSTATITLGALATTLGGAIAGVTIPQALKR